MKREWDPVDWMSGALFVVYGSVRQGDPRTGRPYEEWRRDATEALDFLARHGIALARVDDREKRTLRAWRASDLVCRVFGHRPPRRWYSNAAGDGGGWICTRCLAELPSPVSHAVSHETADQADRSGLERPAKEEK